MTFTRDTAHLKLLRGETPTLKSYVEMLRRPHPATTGPVWWQATAPQTPQSRTELVHALMAQPSTPFINVYTPLYDTLSGKQDSPWPARSEDLTSVALVYHAAQLILDLRDLLEQLPDSEDEIVSAALPSVRQAQAAYEQVGISHPEVRALRRDLLSLSPGEVGWTLTEAFGPAEQSADYLIDGGSSLSPSPLRRLLRAVGRHSALQEATSRHLLNLVKLNREAPLGAAERRVAGAIATGMQDSSAWNPGEKEAELIRQLRALQPDPRPDASPLTALAGLHVPWPEDSRRITLTNNTLALWMLAELRRRCPQLTSWRNIGGSYVLSPDHPLAGALPELVRAELVEPELVDA